MDTIPTSPGDLKALVRAKYAEIALSETASPSACCGVSGCGTVEFSDFSDDYFALEGYVPDADLNLGCGLPTEHAGIQPGDTVLDLGSGAGIDAFVARSLAGDSGTVIGVDMTLPMIDRARKNADKLGYTNVEFRLGDIESLPVADESVDVVISNCVLNLVPDKSRAFGEIYRVLRPGAHFCISDVVSTNALPEFFRQAAELYAGCVSGAMTRGAYLRVIEEAGFTNIQVVKERRIDVPQEVYDSTLPAEESDSLHHSDIGLLSITLVGEKPEACRQQCCPACTPG